MPYISTCLIHALPLDQRRVFSREEAASYVGVSHGYFDKLVAKGRLPAPLPFEGVRRWDKAALDRRLNDLSGLESEARAPSKRSPYDEWSASLGQR